MTAAIDWDAHDARLDEQRQKLLEQAHDADKSGDERECCRLMNQALVLKMKYSPERQRRDEAEDRARLDAIRMAGL